VKTRLPPAGNINETPENWKVLHTFFFWRERGEDLESYPRFKMNYLIQI